MKDMERLFIIDGSSLMYRAFHAIPTSLTDAKGMSTNAIYGFTQTLTKILKEFSPEYIGVAFDVKGPTFRHEKFAEYKSERPPMPELLGPQIPYIKRILRAFNIPVLEKASFEADDIIATIVKKVAASGIKTAVITGDKDMYQLVDDSTVIFDYLTGTEFGFKEVEEKFGVPPHLIKDLLGLAGDPSDGIPGVPGIGVKTAAKLLKQYGGLDGIYANIDKISGEKLRENLKKNRDMAFLSRDLATLHMDAAFEWSIDGLRRTEPDYDELISIFKELNFVRLLKEVMPQMETTEDKSADCVLISSSGGAASSVEEIKSAKYRGRVAVTLLLSEDGEELIGVAAAPSPSKAFYIPKDGAGEALIAGFLKAILEDNDTRKDSDDFKALYLYSARNNIKVSGLGIDTSLASYLLDPSRTNHSIESLAYEYLGILTKEESVAGLETDAALKVACKKACNIFQIAEMLDKKLEVNGLKNLYLEMELPLTEVLAGMELIGIKADKEVLKGLSKEIEVRLGEIETSIYRAAGLEFNIKSPKQLSEVLFERLKLKPAKRTKTGYSTDEEVLTELAKAHEVPGLILGYRQFSKLKSTYVDALIEIIDPVTGRIHTSFNQTVTATGRLSSSRPNLQNIPVRGEWAARVREAFVADSNFIFVSADYSQIELRLVAHMAQDPALIDAFKKDEDIHARTAAEIFGIKDPSLVTPELRRRAKAINFGIIYGMGPYGLSSELGIPLKEATDYINNYFEHYRAVKVFIESTIEEAAKMGYTTTLFGRRRFIPELKSPVDSVARLGERLAVNTPIQGSAADIIKAAMIRIFRTFKSGFKSRMLLQIHDELVFEVAEGEKDGAIEIIKKEMEGVVHLSVPIKVNIKSGYNWRTVE